MTKPVASTIGAAQLAKLINLDEMLLGELANRARLPFQVSTDKGLHIAPADLAAWLGARRRYAHWLDEPIH
jgi:hypothetical protein